MRTAAIGIGSNSLRMLLAEISGGELHRLKRYREGMRTFAALDENGNIVPEMIVLACQKVGEFVAQARQAGAETVHIFATSAIRDAKNQAEFIEQLERAVQLPVEVCPGELEARLSYIGATGKGPSGLIDIGGGSTEIAMGKGMNVREAVSLQLGAVRLFRSHPIADEATAEKALEAARQLVRPAAARFQTQENLQWVGVGGTFTLAAALAQQIPWNEKEKIHQYVLSRPKVREILMLLAPMPVEERLLLPSMQPNRADIAAHGMAILLACMEELALETITVSEYGNLEGYLKVKYLS
mgnify:FL=1